MNAPRRTDVIELRALNRTLRTFRRVPTTGTDIGRRGARPEPETGKHVRARRANRSGTDRSQLRIYDNGFRDSERTLSTCLSRTVAELSFLKTDKSYYRERR